MATDSVLSKTRTDSRPCGLRVTSSPRASWSSWRSCPPTPGSSFHQVVGAAPPPEAGGRGREEFLGADNIKNGVTKLTGKGNIFKAIASEAIDAAGHHDTRMTSRSRCTNGSTTSSRAVWPASAAPCRRSCRSSRRRARPPPFIGLFGTVWGIYTPLVAIASRGQASNRQRWPVAWVRR